MTDWDGFGLPVEEDTPTPRMESDRIASFAAHSGKADGFDSLCSALGDEGRSGFRLSLGERGTDAGAET